jgi:hypothetical protein
MYRVFQDPDFNYLCKIGQVLYGDGQLIFTDPGKGKICRDSETWIRGKGWMCVCTNRNGGYLIN